MWDVARAAGCRRAVVKQPETRNAGTGPMPAPRAMSAPFATLSTVDTASAATAIATMDSPATWEPDQKMMSARMPADGRSRLAPGLHLGEGADGAAARQMAVRGAN